MMSGSETVRMSRPDLSEYTIRDDESTSSSDNDDTEPNSPEKADGRVHHGFTSMWNFGKSKSSSSGHESGRWSLFRRERASSSGNTEETSGKEEYTSQSPSKSKDLGWFGRKHHKSRPSTVPNTSINLHEEALSSEDHVLLSANTKLDAMLHDSFENLVNTSASPTKHGDIETSDSGSEEMDSLREASRLIKSKLQAGGDNDSPETPPNESMMKIHFKPPNNGISIYDYVYESPNAKNSKNIDLMTVDTNSVTFGKLQRIATCLKGTISSDNSEQSIVSMCDYVLTLAKECENRLIEASTVDGTKVDLKEFEKKISEIETLQKQLDSITAEYGAKVKDFDQVQEENNTLKGKLKEVIEFNNICKQFFGEYKGQINSLYEQVKKETSRNETLVEKQERIAREYESEKSRNEQLSENLFISQEVLQDIERRYLKTIDNMNGPEKLHSLSCLEAENSDLKAVVEKLSKNNNRLVKDCQRERKKVLDLRKQKDLTAKYVEGILSFHNQCFQFITQFVMSFKSAIDPSDFMQVEQQLYRVSTFNPLSFGNVDCHSEKDLLAHVQSFEADSSDLFNNLISNVVVQVFNKFMIDHNSNKFLTTELRSVRREVVDKQAYIDSILQETNSLKMKLKRAEKMGKC